MTDTDAQVVEKKMTRDERRALEKVIKGDIQILREEFGSEIDTAWEKERSEIVARFDDKRDEMYKKQRTLSGLADKWRTEYNDLIDEFRRDGYVVDTAYSTTPTIRIESRLRVEGLKEALAAAEKRFAQIRANANRALNKQELDTTRRLMLTGIASQEATDLLDSLPTPQQILFDALESYQAKQLEARPFPQE